MFINCRIVARGVPGLPDELRRLAGRYPAMTDLHFELAAIDGGFEGHIEMRFPQHQIIVDAAAFAPERAVREVVAKAARELARLEARDPSVAAPLVAKAA